MFLDSSIWILWYLVEKVVILPTYSKDLAKQYRKSVKAKWIIFDLVKDYLIRHIMEKKMIKEMHTTLVTLYQSENMSTRMLSENKPTQYLH